MARGLQAKQSQDKAAKAAKGAAKGKADKVKRPTGAICGVCKTEVQQLGKSDATALVKLNEHISSKHTGKSAKTLAECFPKYTPAALARAAGAEKESKSNGGYAADKPIAVKKKQTHKRG